MKQTVILKATQKPMVGLLLVGIFVLIGAGCTESAQTVNEQVQATSTEVTAKVDEVKATVSDWQKTLVKLQNTL